MVDAVAPDESALLERLRRGEETAFEELVTTHTGRMLAAARRLLGNEHDASDAVQDAFVSAFRSIGAFAGQCRLSTWLHRITVNASLMKLRTKRRKPERALEDLLPKFSEDGHYLEPPAPWDDRAEALLEREETRAQVRAAIDQLPEIYRNALLMRDIAGMSTEEAAEALGISKNAVKIRLHRAHQALRTLLDAQLRSCPS